eukprot:TRINITY_DN3019_c0_g1_i2.p1 TRINITY_DN3019_c0_g1~~TRINITY_DN3019_c0_g1_i2.p1  ORF type:complete len:117 (+),score=4.93 TRINITY_DN3019_c0_g1_i2:202-552(+)
MIRVCVVRRWRSCVELVCAGRARHLYKALICEVEVEGGLACHALAAGPLWMSGRLETNKGPPLPPRPEGYKTSRGPSLSLSLAGSVTKLCEKKEGLVCCVTTAMHTTPHCRAKRNW